MLTSPGLIETMFRSAGGTVPRLHQHLHRLERSATALEIKCDIDAIRREVLAIEENGFPSRMRLELSPDGQWLIDTTRFTEGPPGRIWRLAVAQTKLCSTDPLLRHKTTQRHHYESARKEFATDAADEVILLNERGEICEGTISSFFVRRQGQNQLLTPALECGLLQGVLRQHLLDSGKARETILRIEDLHAEDDLFVGNALRGLIAARLPKADIAKPIA